jgi:Ceramidase
MLFVTGIVLHRIVTVATSTAYTIWVGASLTTFLVILSYVHCATDELIMHSITFGTMIAVIGLKTMHILQTIESPLIRKRVSALSTAGAGRFQHSFCFPEDP